MLIDKVWETWWKEDENRSHSCAAAPDHQRGALQCKALCWFPMCGQTGQSAAYDWVKANLSCFCKYTMIELLLWKLSWLKFCALKSPRLKSEKAIKLVLSKAGHKLLESKETERINWEGRQVQASLGGFNMEPQDLCLSLRTLLRAEWMSSNYELILMMLPPCLKHYWQSIKGGGLKQAGIAF